MPKNAIKSSPIRRLRFSVALCVALGRVKGGGEERLFGRLTGQSHAAGCHGARPRQGGHDYWVSHCELMSDTLINHTCAVSVSHRSRTSLNRIGRDVDVEVRPRVLHHANQLSVGRARIDRMGELVGKGIAITIPRCGDNPCST